MFLILFAYYGQLAVPFLITNGIKSGIAFICNHISGYDLDKIAKLILNTNVDFDICLSRIMNMRLLRMVAFLLKGQNVDLDSEFHHFQDPIVVFLD